VLYFNDVQIPRLFDYLITNHHNFPERRRAAELTWTGRGHVSPFD